MPIPILICLVISELHSLEYVHHNRSIGSVYPHDLIFHLLGVSLHVSLLNVNHFNESLNYFYLAFLAR